MKPQIESGIPLPPQNRKWASKYPFGDLNVGDSFLVPNGKQPVIASSAAAYGHRHGKKFSTRQVDGGVRVWRTE